ncbi:AraC family transcriptional regulator [Amycolatopsis rhabdoformis]|uniref:AraC family transcriptional regulator n=1 Tax=Amycolatopsis rhabdoformis TaxID=1448059 RepID=A0ABZ1ILR5_9PSEU|nr:AraC family transcriptional regulator [Amycolatopsis rhabdoformis]WSE34728.1 AraC family transcriptional regulator [Amycolatopsis rhabdoformis]
MQGRGPAVVDGRREPVPLREHLVVATRDPREAASEGAAALSPHRLRPLGAEGFFATRLHAVAVGGLTLAFVEYAGEVAVEATAPMDYYTLLVPVRGRLQVFKDGLVAGVPCGSGAVVGPGDGLRLRFAPGTAELIVKIPVEVLQRNVAPPLSDAPLPRFALVTGAVADWLTTVRFAAGTVDRCTGRAVPHATGELLERMVLSSLLLSHPHDGTDRLFSIDSARRRTVVVQVVDEFRRIAERGDSPPPIPDLARVHGISVRALQESFRQVVGVPPTAYLRDLRLDRAHRELTGDPSGTVAEVAHRVGFGHLGRFSGAYRRRFGVSPSATLSAARVAHRG